MARTKTFELAAAHDQAAALRQSAGLSHRALRPAPPPASTFSTDRAHFPALVWSYGDTAMKIYGFCQKSPYLTLGDVQAVADHRGCTNYRKAISGTNEHLTPATDLGMSNDSTRKHDIYDTAFPDGWECEWVAAIEKFRRSTEAQ